MMTISLSALALATIGGLVSFLSPCVLPLVPGYLSFISGSAQPSTSNGPRPARVLVNASAFVTGFIVVFVLLGLSAQALGGALQRYAWEANLIGGVLIIVFGLSLFGLLRLPKLLGEYRWLGPSVIHGPESAFLLGIAFAFGWTPCIGPVLASILVATATSAASGAVLLGAYGVGLGVPFILAALFFDRAFGVVKRLRYAGRILNLIAGLVLMMMGVLMITGRLQMIAIWLLESFPLLGQLG